MDLPDLPAARAAAARRRPVTLFAILAAEGRRQARRGSTYALRFGYALVLVAALGALWWSGPREAGDEAVGRVLFAAYRDVVLLLAVGLAPLLVAIGAVEDRDDGSIGLLVVAGLGPGQILLGKVLARLMGLFAVVLGGVPILGLAAALGGVSPWEVANATANALVLMLVIGSMAGLFALSSRRVLAPVLLAASWGWLAFFLLPSLFKFGIVQHWLHWKSAWLLRWGEWAIADGVRLYDESFALSPVLGMTTADAKGLLPVAVGLAAMAVVSSAAGPVFAAMTGARRGVRVVLAWRIGGIAGIAVGVALWDLAMGWQATVRGLTASALSPWVLWLAALCVLVAGTALYVDLSLWLLGDGERPLSRPARDLRGNPIAWREGIAGMHGGESVRGWWAAGLLGSALLVGWWAAPPNPLRPAHLDPSFALLIAGVLVTATVATASIAQEVGGGTLPLVVGSRMRARSIVAGKLYAVGLRGLPVLVLGIALRDARLLPWTALLWAALALACFWVALRLRPPSLAWTVNFLGVSAILLAVPLSALVPDGAGPVRATIAPFLGNDPLPTEVVACSSLGMALVVATLWVGATRAMARGGATPA